MAYKLKNKRQPINTTDSSYRLYRANAERICHRDHYSDCHCNYTGFRCLYLVVGCAADVDIV